MKLYILKFLEMEASEPYFIPGGIFHTFKSSSLFLYLTVYLFFICSLFYHLFFCVLFVNTSKLFYGPRPCFMTQDI